MRQIAIPTNTWTEDRFTTLLEVSGWSAATAVGVLTLLWAKTREAKDGPGLTGDELRCALSHAPGDVDLVFGYLILGGYVRLNDAKEHVVVDNQQHFAVRKKLREAGARGGYRQHRSQQPKKLTVAKAPKPAKSQPSGVSLAWQAYADAYHCRYGVTPVRNATVNGQLARLVGLVGADLPQLARFYVQHDNAFYVRCQHSIGALLKDYSGLYTQLHRNVTVTENDVKAHSDTFRLDHQLRRLGVQ